VAFRHCGDGLRSGAAGTVTLLNCDNHTGEPADVYCGCPRVETVGATMGVRAADSTVVATHLEETGYQPPDGQFTRTHHPR